ALVIGKTLPIWYDVKSRVEKMKHDILRLKAAGAGSLQDDDTQVRLSQLAEEVERLEDKMDIDDSTELTTQWRNVRKQIRELK
ncbi:hypothetical protein OFN60_39505, partial [Escherichia coli]|nr:hypothetical protein [Escherichia coli]